jgi:hypothetical protein
VKENSILMDKNGIPTAKKNKCEEVWRDYSEELLNRIPADIIKITATGEAGQANKLMPISVCWISKSPSTRLKNSKA